MSTNKWHSAKGQSKSSLSYSDISRIAKMVTKSLDQHPKRQQQPRINKGIVFSTPINEVRRQRKPRQEGGERPKLPINSVRSKGGQGGVVLSTLQPPNFTNGGRQAAKRSRRETSYAQTVRGNKPTDVATNPSAWQKKPVVSIDVNTVVTTQTLRLNNSVINAVRVDTLFAEWSVACGMEFLSVCSKLQKIAGVMKKQVSKGCWSCPLCLFLRPQRKSVVLHLQHQHKTESFFPSFCTTSTCRRICLLPDLGRTCALSASVGLLALVPSPCSEKTLSNAFTDPSLDSAAALASSLNTVNMPCSVFKVLATLMLAFAPSWSKHCTSNCGTCGQQGEVSVTNELFLSVAAKKPVSMAVIRDLVKMKSRPIDKFCSMNDHNPTQVVELTVFCPANKWFMLDVQSGLKDLYPIDFPDGQYLPVGAIVETGSHARALLAADVQNLSEVRFVLFLQAVTEDIDEDDDVNVEDDDNEVFVPMLSNTFRRNMVAGSCGSCGGQLREFGGEFLCPLCDDAEIQRGKRALMTQQRRVHVPDEVDAEEDLEVDLFPSLDVDAVPLVSSPSSLSRRVTAALSADAAEPPLPEAGSSDSELENNPSCVEVVAHPDGATFSWAFCPLLAIAAGKRHVDAARLCLLVGPRIFCAMVSLLAPSCGALPWSRGYVSAEVQNGVLDPVMENQAVQSFFAAVGPLNAGSLNAVILPPQPIRSWRKTDRATLNDEVAVIVALRTHTADVSVGELLLNMVPLAALRYAGARVQAWQVNAAVRERLCRRTENTAAGIGAPPPISTCTSLPPQSDQVVGISWEEIAKVRPRLLKTIPYTARPAVASAFTHLCLTKNWLLLFGFAKLVLCVPQLARGGTADRAHAIQQRCALLTRGEIGVLWAGCLASCSLRPPTEKEGEEFNSKRCIAAAKRGEFGRATRFLDGAQIVQQDAGSVAALQALHPVGELDVCRIDGEAVCPPTEVAMLQLLRSFPRGSAGGTSALTAQHLREICGCPGTASSALVTIIGDFVNGNLPEVARKFFYGARLIAFRKPDGGVRPIASGEVFRRLAGKHLARSVERGAGSFFKDAGQIGVATPDGASALVHAARRISLTLSSDEVFLKVDWRNAFNCVSRRKILSTVATTFPALARYTSAAYGSPTSLLYGDTIIPSEAGVQQGDPLGPLLFSLALVGVSNSIRPFNPIFQGWYLDDGIIAIKANRLDEVIEQLQIAGTEIGLCLNLHKCEVIGSHQLPVHHTCGLKNFDDWELLGVPMGSTHARAMAWTKLLDASVKKIGQIGAVGQTEPHVASTLLHWCGALPMMQYNLQHWDGCIDLTPCDVAMRAAFPVTMDDTQWEQAKLPIRHGGFGVPTIADRASTFCAVSAKRCEKLCGIFISTPIIPDALPDFALLLTPRAPIGVFEHLEQELSSEAPRVRNVTRKWDDEQAALVLARVSHRMKGIIQSATAPGASLWVAMPPACSEFLWLDPGLYFIAAKLRLGLPLNESGTVCPQCRQATDDTLGDHALKCMSGGRRTLAHNAIRDTVNSLLSECLLRPHRETHPFAANPAARMDISVLLDGKEYLVDIALTHPVQARSQNDAANTPGGAATAYEAVKVAEYGAHVNIGTQVLVPLVFDTFGAVGVSGQKFLARIASEYSKRYLSGRCGRLEFFARLNGCVTHQVALIAATNLPAMNLPAGH